jgi:hypothetical protein
MEQDNELQKFEKAVEAAFKRCLDEYMKNDKEVLIALERKENFREQYFFNNGVKYIMEQIRLQKELDEKKT